MHNSVNICVASYVNFQISNLESLVGIRNLCKKNGEIRNLACDFWVVSDPRICLQKSCRLAEFQHIDGSARWLTSFNYNHTPHAGTLPSTCHC